MAKKDEKPNEIVNGQTEQSSDNPAQTVSPEQAENQALREELAQMKADYVAQTAELAQVQYEKQELLAQIAVLQTSKQPEKPTTQDTRKSVWVKTANGAEFWRSGVLFNGEWREVNRAEVGETAWARITDEPALVIKQAA